MAEMLLAGGAFLSYALVAVNTRACAHARYSWVAMTDAAILLVNFTIIKHIAGADTRSSLLAYMVGGTIGGLLGVWLSRKWGSDA